MKTIPLTQATFGVAQIEMEIPVKAAPTRVWDALVRETSRWWHKDFFTSPAAKEFVIEPQLGGRAYENWGEGSGQVWYTVIGVQAPAFLMMQGILTAGFGGPAITILHLVLKPSGKSTILQLSDTIFGKVRDDKLGQTREGWSLLFEGGLKKYVEGN